MSRTQKIVCMLDVWPVVSEEYDCAISICEAQFAGERPVGAKRYRIRFEVPKNIQSFEEIEILDIAAVTDILPDGQ